MNHAKQHKHQRADEVREFPVIDCFTELDEGPVQILLAFRIVRFRPQFTKNRRDDNASEADLLREPAGLFHKVK